ncbi:MAG TPA: RsmG family class I SAM-dependent methyltransferase [Acidimicrobiales bacterium]|nr:RsmG family class I SAM-dependent methyltransferase [Acidimicrobiales bacterium]
MTGTTERGGPPPGASAWDGGEVDRAELESRLLPVLEEARALGLLGPGPLLPHLDHALGFGAAASADDGGGDEGLAAWGCLDLGSGGGVPGLPLAVAWPQSRWTLVDAGARRVDFLVGAVRRMALEDRVEVVGGRAEQLARHPRMRGCFDLVVARGFAPPAVTAECAAGFLVPGGRAVVSEPPGGRPSRWPASGLAPLGMEPDGPIEVAGASYQVLRQRAPCPDRYPRRTGIPSKRPLFTTD